MPSPTHKPASPQIDNSYATTLKALHVPSHPIVFANIYDPASTTALLSLNTPPPTSQEPHPATAPTPSSSKPLVRAVATASYAIAASLGIADEDLTLEQNISAIRAISPLVRAAGLPLSVDLQDGYGEQLDFAVREAIRAGAVGANIEDSYPERGFGVGLSAFRECEAQCGRIRRILEVARGEGVGDFVVNARTDVFRLSPAPEGWDESRVVEEAVRRGRAYLEAGATCVFVWGGSGRGVRRGEVEILVRELKGRVAVKLADGEEGLSVRELAEIGVCRISVGPSLWAEAMKAVKRGAERILTGGQLWPGN
jgi:2-methylisocitrate lyase-like PEP mutase family enzyme